MATELGYPVTSNHFVFKILRIISNNKLNIGTNLINTCYYVPLKLWIGRPSL